MIEHTPGPWSIKYGPDCTELIASNGESIMGDMTYYPWVPDNQADWNLIAAAPELLEVLEAFERATPLWLPKEVAEEHVEEAQALHQLRNMALAAIAKARGSEGGE